MTDFRCLDLSGVLEITPRRHGDERGYFCEVYKQSAFEHQGILIDWVQDNESLSAQVGTVRGLHFQAPPFAQDKLVRVLRGAIFDVAVDIRSGSPTYGRWVGIEISAEKGNQILVPAGFAHCFMTTQPDTHVMYKVSAPYSKESEGAVLWNDPSLAIEWPKLGLEPVLSEKDRDAPPLAVLKTPFVFES